MAINQSEQKNPWGWGAKALLFLVLLTFGVLIWQAIQPWVNRPLDQIILQTNVPNTEKLMLQNQLNARLTDSFFKADLEAIRLEVEANPWVSDAKVSRLWPNRLMVEASAQIFMARWGDGGFINHLGEVVNVDPKEVPSYTKLPQLDGPPGSSWSMSEMYRQMSWLVSRDGLRIDAMNMANRGAVELRLDNDVTFVLGREQVLSRLQRLMKVYHAHLVDKSEQILRIDGRYAHGISVQWKEGS